jgi:hypothetical protein
MFFHAPREIVLKRCSDSEIASWLDRSRISKVFLIPNPGRLQKADSVRKICIKYYIKANHTWRGLPTYPVEEERFNTSLPTEAQQRHSDKNCYSRKYAIREEE